MPRNGSGIYSKAPGTTAVAGETILSAKYNAQVDDMVQEMNGPRPVTAGGTGAVTVDQARDNLGAQEKNEILGFISELDAADSAGKFIKFNSEGDGVLAEGFGDPVGTVFWFAGTSAPDGSLVLDGSVITPVYPDLRQFLIDQGSPWGVDANGDPKLADLRGEFIRGWDNGRGVDAGRAFGSFQSTQSQDHSHRMPMGFFGGTFYGWKTGNGDTPPIFGSETLSGKPRARVSGVSENNSNVNLAYTDGVRELSGESRPRNIALLPCIRAFDSISPLTGELDQNAILAALAAYASVGGRLINIQVFDTAGSGTYTPTDGTTYILVEACGGGGAGGDADGDNSENQIGVGGGGGSGGYAKFYAEVLATSYNYTIGAGGAGSTSSANGVNAASGSNTTFTAVGGGTSSFSLTSDGGTGGQARIDTNASRAYGGTGGLSSVTAVDTPWTPIQTDRSGSGTTGIAITGADLAGAGLSLGGIGGVNPMSNIFRGVATDSPDASEQGFDAVSGGGGGGGAVAVGASTHARGGNGAAGKIIIMEFA